MSRRASELALLALWAAGCTHAPAIDLCSPDDGLKAALVGGQLRAEVRAADGTPRAAADAAVDRPSALALGRAEEGDWIVIEAVDATAAPLAYGAARVHDQAACVCLARTSWYAYSVEQIDAGSIVDGPPVGFFVHDARQRAPAVAPRLPVTLDRALVQPGDVLRATTQYGSDATAALDVRSIEVLARPPGATHVSGLVRGFTAVTAGSVAAGGTLSVDASRTFGGGDVAGAWAVFTRLTDALGVVHDGPETSFAFDLAAGDLPPLRATAPPRLNAAWFSAGDTLHVSASFQNASAAPVMFQQLKLTAIPPGGDMQAGPFDDLAPSLGATTVGVGATLDVAGDRRLGPSDDPCAGQLCVVRGGSCQLSAAP